MSNYAVLDDNGTVINVIVCETLDLAEALTGRECVEADGNASIVLGSQRVNNEWRLPDSVAGPILSNEELQAIALANKINEV